MIDQTLAQAHALLQRRDVTGASRIVEPLAARHPNHAGVHHMRGLVLRDGGDFPGARESLTHAVELSGGAAEIRNTLGNLLVDMGALEEADAQFAAAIAKVPGYAPAYINRGRLASKQGRHAEAEELLRRACALDPRSSLARVSLGNALRAGGKGGEAVPVLREAVALNPRGNARAHLASALRALDQPLEAVAEYDAAERDGQVSAALLEGRAGAWIEAGEVEEARADADRLVSQFPDYLAGHRSRARLIWEWGLEGDPFDSYRMAAERWPGEREVWHAWLGTLMSFGQFEQAVEVASAADRAVGPTGQSRASRALALSELGRLDEADGAFRAAEAAIGNEPGFRSTQMRHLLRSGRPDEAARIGVGIMAAQPLDQTMQAYLGTAWRMLDDPREYWLHDYERFVARIEARPPGFEEDAAAFAASVAPLLRGLHISRVHPADQSLRGGTQTMGALFDRPEPGIAAIRQAVTYAAEAFMHALPRDAVHPFLSRARSKVAFTGSWSVRLTRAGFHINHVHNQGWLSSAFYFALPPADPDDKPEAGWLALGEPPAELGLDLPPRRLIKPEVGTLALFPSSMWHGTVPFHAEGERLTAAFDIVPAA